MLERLLSKGAETLTELESDSPLYQAICERDR